MEISKAFPMVVRTFVTALGILLAGQQPLQLLGSLV